ncbi:signal peptidase II [Chloroflexota bacterium]
MRKVDHHPGKWWYAAFFLVALLVVTADQISKLWIRTNYQGQPLYELGFFRIIFVQNTGAAFGIFPNQNFALTIFDIVGIALILIFAFLLPRLYPGILNRAGIIALGMIMAGTTGNLFDRINQGFVTDFISVWIWPTFNVADSSVVVGVIIFASTILYTSKQLEAADDG